MRTVYPALAFWSAVWRGPYTFGHGQPGTSTRFLGCCGLVGSDARLCNGKRRAGISHRVHDVPACSDTLVRQQLPDPREPATRQPVDRGRGPVRRWLGLGRIMSRPSHCRARPWRLAAVAVRCGDDRRDDFASPRRQPAASDPNIFACRAPDAGADSIFPWRPVRRSRWLRSGPGRRRRLDPRCTADGLRSRRPQSACCDWHKRLRRGRERGVRACEPCPPRPR